MELTKKDWILLILREAPMDRIHIMKTLFLIWHRNHRNLPNYFEFVPYLYGPCSFDAYSVLKNLQRSGFIAQPPHPMSQWVNYYLTEKGKKETKEFSEKAPPETLRIIKEVANEISKLNFYELLRKVYKEAPDFASNSMFKGVIKI
jgi:uncharacterized protein YwgA